MAVYDPAVPLLSFIYRVYTDEDFQTKFKNDPEGAMNEYALSWDQKTAIYHSGAIPTYVTPSAVPNYPILLDKTQISNVPSEGKPNPVTGDWWAAFARFKSDVEAGRNPAAIPNPRVNDRPHADQASLMGVMTLRCEELSQDPKWTSLW